MSWVLDWETQPDYDHHTSRWEAAHHLWIHHLSIHQVQHDPHAEIWFLALPMKHEVSLSCCGLWSHEGLDARIFCTSLIWESLVVSCRISALASFPTIVQSIPNDVSSQSVPRRIMCILPLGFAIFSLATQKKMFLIINCVSVYNWVGMNSPLCGFAQNRTRRRCDMALRYSSCCCRQNITSVKDHTKK